MRRLVAIALLWAGCSQTKSVELGSEGGVLTPNEVPWARLRVPPGALQQPTALFLRPHQERFAGTVGPAIEAGPHGTRFEHPVALRFSPTPQDLGPGIHFGELKVATLENGLWHLLPTSFPAPGVIEGLTTHFSTFALIAPCHASGLAHDFPLTGCSTFNPRIQTSADVNLEVRAFPVTVLLNIRPTPGAGSVDFTVSGLRAGWTYFLSRDSAAQLDPLVADASGAVRFAQDVFTAHSLLLMAQHGSITLSPTTCPTIGVWESATRTCTLTQDYLTPPINRGDDNINLDCAGHIIGGPARGSSGIDAVRNGHTVRNCAITNVDIGIHAFGDRLTVADTSISMPNPGLRGGEAIILTDSNDAVLSNLNVSDFTYGMSVSGGGNLLIQSATFRVSEIPIDVGAMSNVTLNDVVVDGALFDDLEPPVGAVQLSGAHGVNINRLSTRGTVTGVTSVVAALFDSDVIVADSNIGQGHIAVRLDGPGTSFVVRSTLSQNAQALQLNGGTNYVFHNNLIGNGSPVVVALGPVDLFDSRPSSPTFQHGNFWGRACPDPLFVVGVDSNLGTAVDLFPYGVASSWDSGGVPGCVQPPPLSPPILTAPSDGLLLNSGAVSFEGSSVPGATVQVLEGTSLKATGTASSTGEFAIVASPVFPDGAHVISARASLAGLTSGPSTSRTFTVDSAAPAAPVITFPTTGANLVESSPFVVGTAEPLSRIEVKVDGTTLAFGSTSAAGQFQFRLAGVMEGPHELRARAVDAAGNSSVDSSSIAFTIVGHSQPMQGAAGRLVVTSATDAPDAFEASAGESNFVIIRGEFSGAAGGANAQYELVLSRMSRSSTGGSTLATAVTRTPIARPQGNASSVAQGTVGWNGRDSAGQLAAPGV